MFVCLFTSTTWPLCWWSASHLLWFERRFICKADWALYIMAPLERQREMETVFSVYLATSEPDRTERCFLCMCLHPTLGQNNYWNINTNETENNCECFRKRGVKMLHSNCTWLQQTVRIMSLEALVNFKPSACWVFMESPPNPDRRA